jgi:hypothetical protein
MVETAGVAVPSSVDDGQFALICKLLNFIASEDSREPAYFGIRGETCLPVTQGQMRLFMDPSTARPYDIVQKYPSAQVLFLLGRSLMSEHDSLVPSELPPDVKLAGAEAAALYNASAIDEGDGFLARFIRTAAKERLESGLDYNAAFNQMVISDEPLEEMFEVFREECEAWGIRRVIEEVNGVIGDE